MLILQGADVAGRPWTKYEAYQLILQEQADALITLGAKPFLKVYLKLFCVMLSFRAYL
jgi:hypothetical protein